MSHQSVSTPLNLREGVRVTSGRAPAAKPVPKLDIETAQLLATLPKPLTEEGFVRWCKQLAEHPTRPGARALEHLSNVGRHAGLTGAADHLAQVSKAISEAVATRDAVVSLVEVLQESLMAVYQVGVGAGRQKLAAELEADRSQPVRRTEFVSDATGKITGKIEYELKPGGKS
jgi:hypothetical protein